MKIQLFNVAPAMPEELAFLETLAHNMWWCWNIDAIELFRRIDPQLIRECQYNPLLFLNRVPQERFEQLAKDSTFLNHLGEIQEQFEHDTKPVEQEDGSCVAGDCTAYFSLEFGIHDSIKLYSGGLGVLAGDHLKASSCLGIPLVGVGLLYRQGYFQQYLNQDGWQQEHYPENELNLLPLKKALGPNGRQISVTVPFPGGVVRAIVWTLMVGRVPLYLLDTNIPENPAEFRAITAQLYGGDKQMRLRQELMLGIGGFRALQALGHHPAVCHMNEGHAAFLSLARIGYLVKERGLDIETATEIVARTNVFTTHTPVPAGNETFHLDLLRPYLEALKPEVAVDPQTVIDWGLAPEGHGPHELSMTVLGLRMAHYSNGVSELHGEVARKMWGDLWPGRPDDEIPIRAITNGVHVPSWLSQENVNLFERYLGPDWRHHPSEAAKLIDQIPDEELWRAHEVARARLIRSSREFMERQYSNRNASASELAKAKTVLDHDALTIGFARRFATYKRATLLLSDPERLISILANENRPVQLIFSGKAHPADDGGKALIQKLVHFAKRADIRRHIIFLENYDMNIARRMVQGVDVWLNTPRRPMEASGTSGMKSAANGGIHVSVLDGWWAEAYTPERGWAIGDGQVHDDPEFQDSVEAQALYNLLENEIIPAYYDRPSGYLPLRWIRMMKESIKMGLEFFTSHRMVSDYNHYFYSDARAQYETLLADDAKRAKDLVAQRHRLESLWHKVHLEMPQADEPLGVFYVGHKFKVTCKVHLGELKPEEVDVQLYYGPVNSSNEITKSHVAVMDLEKQTGKSTAIYTHEITCESTGRYGFTARVTPHGTDWRKATTAFITWANGDQG